MCQKDPCAIQNDLLYVRNIMRDQVLPCKQQKSRPTFNLANSSFRKLLKPAKVVKRMTETCEPATDQPEASNEASNDALEPHGDEESLGIDSTTRPSSTNPEGISVPEIVESAPNAGINSDDKNDSNEDKSDTKDHRIFQDDKAAGDTVSKSISLELLLVSAQFLFCAIS